MELFLIACVAAVAGASSLFIYQKLRLTTFAQVSKEIIAAAEKKAKELQETALRCAKEQEQKSCIATLKEEHAFRRKEELLEQKIHELTVKLSEIEKKDKQWKAKQESQEVVLSDLNKAQRLAELELVRVASMTFDEARRELIEKARALSEEECQLLFSKKLVEIEKKLEQEAMKLIQSAILRCADKQAPENQIIFLQLPSEDIKSRIIGRDGRNIRAFEYITGTTLVIDETPGLVCISSFDAKRRHIAKLAMNELIKDGRINPVRIEEVVQKIENGYEAELIHYGQEAARRAHVVDLHPEILRHLGKLKFKASLGQNVLEHSIEVSHIMGLIAAELKLEESKARRIGLLHDIGKALPAETGLSHAIAGRHFALQYGEKEDVCNGIGCHHDEMAPSSYEGALCKAADKISASRIGARSENTEKHFTRLESLEKLALEFSEVDSAYALQAGRELRVFVKPELVSDLQASVLARALAKKIESSHVHSGKVQVTVVREKKAVEFST